MKLSALRQSESAPSRARVIGKKTWNLVYHQWMHVPADRDCSSPGLRVKWRSEGLICQQIKCVCVCVAINQEACARSAWCMVIMTISHQVQVCVSGPLHRLIQNAHPRGVERSSDASFLFSPQGSIYLGEGSAQAQQQQTSLSLGCRVVGWAGNSLRPCSGLSEPLLTTRT